MVIRWELFGILRILDLENRMVTAPGWRAGVSLGVRVSSFNVVSGTRGEIRTGVASGVWKIREKMTWIRD